MSFLTTLFKTDDSTLLVESLLDMVTSTANLASDASAIDPLLDPVRTITSRMGTDGKLSHQDELVLYEVYLKLEEYLSTSDPIRTYSVGELRGRLHPALLTQLEAYEKKGKE